MAKEGQGVCGVWTGQALARAGYWRDRGGYLGSYLHIRVLGPDL